VNAGGGAVVTETLDDAVGVGMATGDDMFTLKLLSTVNVDVDVDVDVNVETSVADWAGGGITLSVTVAPHCERGTPLGQQPASVQ
jgi:hypothetical protein